MPMTMERAKKLRRGVYRVFYNNPIKTKTCQAVVCFKSGTWSHYTINTIPEHADEDEIVKTFKANFGSGCVERVFVVSTEDNKE